MLKQWHCGEGIVQKHNTYDANDRSHKYGASQYTRMEDTCTSEYAWVNRKTATHKIQLKKITFWIVSKKWFLLFSRSTHLFQTPIKQTKCNQPHHTQRVTISYTTSYNMLHGMSHNVQHARSKTTLLLTCGGLAQSGVAWKIYWPRFQGHRDRAYWYIS